jgi:hypothetical protein
MLTLVFLNSKRINAAQQQAEADGSLGEDPECPQLSLSVRWTFNEYEHYHTFPR